MDYDANGHLLAAIAANVQLYVVPYAAYFAGIYIRRRCFAEPNPPSLKVLVGLGVLVCLVIVTPFLQAARMTLIEFGFPYLATIGTVMEQGLVAHETAVTRLQKVLQFGHGPGPDLQPA